MMILSYVILCLIIFGLVSTKPIEEKATIGNNPHDISVAQPFRKAETTLNRYFYLMDSDTDQLAHAMLHLLINNPRSFPFVPPRALNIAFKSLEKKLGEDAADIVSKPILMSIEENSQINSKHPTLFKLTDEIKDKIEGALDKFLEEEENNSHL